MNKIELTGRLCQDAEIRYTPSGFPIINFTLAVKRYKAKEGYQSIDFIHIVDIGKNADGKIEKLVKGKLVKVVGELHINKPRDVGKAYWTEVVSFDVEILENTAKEAKKEEGPKKVVQQEKTVKEEEPINLDDLPW